MGDLRYGQNDYFSINDLEPKMIVHPANPKLNGKNLADIKDPLGVHVFLEFAGIVKQKGAGFINYSWPKPGSETPQPKTSYVTGFEPWGWVIGTGLYIDDLHAEVWRQALSELTIIGIVLLLSGALVFFFVRSISKALIAMTNAMGKVAKGELKIDIPARNRNDEIGTMGQALCAMAGTLDRFVAAQLEMTRAHHQDGRISHAIQAEHFNGAYGDMARNVNEMVKAHIDVQMTFADLMVEYTNNQFGARMNKLPGEWEKVTNAAETIRSKLEAANAAEFNARLKAALDHVSIPVRIANDDGEIVYVNNAMKETLRKYETAFRRQIPGFDPDKVVGGSIGMFFSDPRSAIAQLHGLMRTTTSRLTLGGRDYDVATSPVYGEKGERLGTAAQWNDVTEQLAAEKEIAGIVEGAAAGDFKQRIPEAGKSGFLLEMAHGLNMVLSTSEEALGEIGRVLKALAQGDLSQTIEAEFKGAFADLKENSNGTIERLRAIIQQIRQASESINTASREIATGNNDLSKRTEEQASSLEETASGVEELAATVKLNAENSQQANRLASEASASAARGGEVVGKVVATMAGISESNREIADITTLIDGIAFQTNLLALNAAVEAARAGEQGRGFAVVASEVRGLAQRAAEAAKDIKAVIAASAGKVEDGVKLVQNAGAAMDDIVAQVQRVTAIIGEIAAASKEQSDGVQQVNQAVTQIDQNTQQNAALVEEAAAAAKSLEEQSGALARAVAVFKLAGSARGKPEMPKQKGRVNGLAKSGKSGLH